MRPFHLLLIHYKEPDQLTYNELARFDALSLDQVKRVPDRFSLIVDVLSCSGDLPGVKMLFFKSIILNTVKNKPKAVHY